MHIIDPIRYQKGSKKSHWRKVATLCIICLVLIAGVGAINYFRPLPASTASIELLLPPSKAPDLKWPTAGQAAIAADSLGLLSTNGEQGSVATASTAKVIIALCVLNKDPLQTGQTGPTFTVSASDVNIFNDYVAEDGSLLPVEQGEQITEYEALEALMVPSANNVADSLAQWVFGSQSAYRTYANDFLLHNHIYNTHIGVDASGFDPSTTSTASDLAQLGLLSLRSPILMQISSQKTATLPIAGTVSNYDTVLGQEGINGLKTGNNDSDKGAFIFTSSAAVGTKVIPLTGAIMGAASLQDALSESVQLAGSFQQGFQQVTIAHADQRVGHITTAWGEVVPVTISNNLQLVRWVATPLSQHYTENLKNVSGNIGKVTISAGPANASATLTLVHSIAPPSFLWRLSRL